MQIQIFKGNSGHPMCAQGGINPYSRRYKRDGSGFPPAYKDLLLLSSV